MTPFALGVAAAFGVVAALASLRYWLDSWRYLVAAAVVAVPVSFAVAAYGTDRAALFPYLITGFVLTGLASGMLRKREQARRESRRERREALTL